jgi:hypothetical protein
MYISHVCKFNRTKIMYEEISCKTQPDRHDPQCFKQLCFYVVHRKYVDFNNDFNEPVSTKLAFFSGFEVF